MYNVVSNANEKLQSGIQNASNGFGRIRNNINERVNNVKQNLTSNSQNESSFLGKLNSSSETPKKFFQYFQVELIQ